MSDKTEQSEQPGPDALALRSQSGEDSESSEDGSGVAFDAIGAAAELDAAMAEEQAAPAGDPGAQHGESYTDILESELEALNALITDKDERLRAAEDELGKSNARIEREADKRFEQRSRTMLLEFIEVLDDLERALAAAREVDHNPAVVQGMELVHKGFVARLAMFGVSHLPALGIPFDPEHHDAVSMIPSQDSSQEGKVVAVVREGYLIHGETLRAAGVVVGKASS
jgi:molecular chaperone GrpE